MPEMHWTPLLVEERFAEAAEILKRLPAERVNGYYSLWPRIVYEFADLVGQESPRLNRPWPAAAAISRMEQTLTWTLGLDPIDAKIIWYRAFGERWKTVCWKVGLARTAAQEHWIYAICVVAWRLNGRAVRPRLSRRQIVAMTRAAQI